MSPQNLFTQISSALGDPALAVYPLATIQQSAMRAVHAYSQYRPIKRRIGTGNLVQQVSALDQQAIVVGGYFNVGDSVTLDPFLPTSETAVVADVDMYYGPGQSKLPTTLPYTQLTFVSTLLYAHKSNSMIRQSVSPGLYTVAGQDTYPLPYDFKSPDYTTFDAAVGLKLYWEAEPSFYDASSVYSDLLSGTSWGESTNFSPTNALGWAFNGPPSLNVLGIPGADGKFQNTCNHAGWRFLLSETPQLFFYQTPLSVQQYSFMYNGCHTVESVTTTDQEIIVAYACYTALMGRAAQMNELGGGGDVKIENYEQSVSKNVAALKALACEHLKYFDDKLVNIPYIVSG